MNPTWFENSLVLISIQVATSNSIPIQVHTQLRFCFDLDFDNYCDYFYSRCDFDSYKLYNANVIAFAPISITFSTTPTTTVVTDAPISITCTDFNYMFNISNFYCFPTTTPTITIMTISQMPGGRPRQRYISVADTSGQTAEVAKGRQFSQLFAGRQR